MSLSPSPDDEPAFNSDLEIDCESSISLDTSFYDSESEDEDTIKQKLQLGRRSSTTHNSSSDSKLVELKTDSSGSDKDSSDWDDSSGESEIASPPLKRARYGNRLDLAPKQHSVLVTRRRLSKQHLESLRSRRALPNTKIHETQSDSSSEYETAAEEEQEEEQEAEEQEEKKEEKKEQEEEDEEEQEKLVEMLENELKNGEGHLGERKEGKEKRELMLENMEDDGVVKSFSEEKEDELDSEEKENEETGKEEEKEERDGQTVLETEMEDEMEGEIKIGKGGKEDMENGPKDWAEDTEQKEKGTFEGEEELERTKQMQEFEFEGTEESEGEEDLEKSVRDDACIIEENIGVKAHVIELHYSEELDCKDATASRVETTPNGNDITACQNEAEDTKNQKAATSVIPVSKSDNSSATQFSSIEVLNVNKAFDSASGHNSILSRSSKKGLNHRQKFIDKKSRLFKGAFKHRKKFVSRSVDHIKRKYAAGGRTTRPQVNLRIDSSEHRGIHRQENVSRHDLRMSDGMELDQSSDLVEPVNLATPISISSDESENESIECTETCFSAETVDSNTEASKVVTASLVTFSKPETNVSNVGDPSTASLTRKFVFDQSMKLVEITEPLQKSPEELPDPFRYSEQNSQTIAQTSKHKSKTSETLESGFRSKSLSGKISDLSNPIMPSRSEELPCSGTIEGTELQDIEPSGDITEETSRSDSNVEIITKNSTDETSPTLTGNTVSQNHSNILQGSAPKPTGESPGPINDIEPDFKIDLTIPPSIRSKLKGLFKNGATELSSKDTSRSPDTCHLKTDSCKDASAIPESHHQGALSEYHTSPCRKRRMLKPPMSAAPSNGIEPKNPIRITHIPLPASQQSNLSDLNVCSRDTQSKMDASSTSSTHQKLIPGTPCLEQQNQEALLPRNADFKTNGVTTSKNAGISLNGGTIPSPSENIEKDSLKKDDLSSALKADQNYKNRSKENLPPAFEKLSHSSARSVQAESEVSSIPSVDSNRSEKTSQNTSVPSVPNIATGPRKFNPFSVEAADALKSCKCDLINVGMLLTAKQIRKKTWPYRIESIFLSLLGEPTMSYCRSCCFRNDNRSFHKNIKVGNVLSESCFLFTWAMDDEIKSPVRTIALLKTKHLEVLKQKFGGGAYYPCFGQCGIVSCGYISFSVAALRRHIKERNVAAIKYCGLPVKVIREEYRSRVAPITRVMGSAKPRTLPSIFARGCSIWSDNSNQADMMNATKPVKEPVDVPLTSVKNNSAGLDEMDFRFLELIQSLKTNNTDLLIDTLISCFYSALSCERCWDEACLSFLLPDIWLQHKAVHYQNCRRPRRPTCHKATSTDDLIDLLIEQEESIYEFDYLDDSDLTHPNFSRPGYSVSFLNDMRKRKRFHGRKVVHDDTGERAARNRSYLAMTKELRHRRRMRERVEIFHKKQSHQSKNPSAVSEGSKTMGQVSRKASSSSFNPPVSKTGPEQSIVLGGNSKGSTSHGEKLNPTATLDKKQSASGRSDNDASAATNPPNNPQETISTESSLPSHLQSYIPKTSPSNHSNTPELPAVSRQEQLPPIASDQQKSTSNIPFDFYPTPGDLMKNVVPVKLTKTPLSDQAPPSTKLNTPTSSAPDILKSQTKAFTNIQNDLKAPIDVKSNSTVPKIPDPPLTKSSPKFPSTTTSILNPASPATRKVAIPICNPGDSPFRGVAVSGSNKYDVMVVGGRLKVTNPRKIRHPETTYTVADKNKPTVYSVPAHKIVRLPNFVRSNTLSELQNVLNSPNFLESKPRQNPLVAASSGITTSNPPPSSDDSTVSQSPSLLDPPQFSSALPRPNFETPTSKSDPFDEILMPLFQEHAALVSGTEETEDVDVVSIETDKPTSVALLEDDKPQALRNGKGLAGSLSTEKRKEGVLKKVLEKGNGSDQEMRRIKGKHGKSEKSLSPRRSKRLSAPSIPPEAIPAESSRRKSERISKKNSLSEEEPKGSDKLPDNTPSSKTYDDPNCSQVLVKNPDLIDEARGLMEDAKSLYGETETLKSDYSLRKRNSTAKSLESEVNTLKDQVLLFSPGKTSKPAISEDGNGRDSDGTNNTVLERYLRSKRRSLAQSNTAKETKQIKDHVESSQSGENSLTLTNVDSPGENSGEDKETLLSSYLRRKRIAARLSTTPGKENQKDQVVSSPNGDKSQASINVEVPRRKSDRITKKDAQNEASSTEPTVEKNSDVNADKRSLTQKSKISGDVGSKNGPQIKNIENDGQKDNGQRVKPKTKSTDVDEFKNGLSANRKLDESIDERLKILNLKPVDKGHSAQSKTKIDDSLHNVKRCVKRTVKFRQKLRRSRLTEEQVEEERKNDREAKKAKRDLQKIRQRENLSKENNALRKVSVVDPGTSSKQGNSNDKSNVERKYASKIRQNLRRSRLTEEQIEEERRKEREAEKTERDLQKKSQRENLSEDNNALQEYCVVRVDPVTSSKQENSKNTTKEHQETPELPSVGTAEELANGTNSPAEVQNQNGLPSDVLNETIQTRSKEPQNSTYQEMTPISDTSASQVTMTLKKRPSPPSQEAVLPVPWEDTVRVKMSGSTVFVNRSELAGDYPHILDILSAALHLRPDDIRGVMNTTQNRKLRPGQDTFSKTLQRDDVLLVSIRRPTEASGQHKTGVDEDLQKLQNAILVQVRFPLSAPVNDYSVSSNRAVWVDKFFNPTPNRTTYTLTDGSAGTLHENHLTYIKRGGNLTFISYLNKDEKPLEADEKGMSKALKEVIIKNLESILEDVTVATTQSDGDKVYLKYWYRDDVFTCFLLSDFTLQVYFSLSETTVVVNFKKDYFCHLRRRVLLDEGSLSLKVLGAELTDKLSYVANFALPVILEDVNC